MEFEVPLYSRSIATGDGGIYLIGGCNKRRNQYLKNCYRYNEIFGTLDELCGYLISDLGIISGVSSRSAGGSLWLEVLSLPW